MLYSLKIVPDDEPNADGTWIEVAFERVPMLSNRWVEIERFFAPLIPKGYHLVQYTSHQRLPDARRHVHGDRFSGLDI